MLVLDLRTQRWHTAPGPAPREHLAATALGGVVYAVGGRLAGDDTNLALLEGFAGGHWSPLPPIPAPRGGTGVAPLAGRLVSIGGEEPAGTIASVYAFDPRTRTWAQLPDLPTPRHGLGVVALGGRVWAIAWRTRARSHRHRRGRVPRSLDVLTARRAALHRSTPGRTWRAGNSGGAPLEREADAAVDLQGMRGHLAAGAAGPRKRICGESAVGVGGGPRAQTEAVTDQCRVGEPGLDRRGASRAALRIAPGCGRDRPP